jgi:uncharacterized protein (DUF58 family)
MDIKFLGFTSYWTGSDVAILLIGIGLIFLFTVIGAVCYSNLSPSEKREIDRQKEIQKTMQAIEMELLIHRNSNKYSEIRKVLGDNGHGKT